MDEKAARKLVYPTVICAAEADTQAGKNALAHSYSAHEVA